MVPPRVPFRWRLTEARCCKHRRRSQARGAVGAPAYAPARSPRNAAVLARVGNGVCGTRNAAQHGATQRNNKKTAGDYFRKSLELTTIKSEQIFISKKLKQLEGRLLRH